MNTDNLSIGLLSTHPERSPAYKRQFSCRPGLLGNEVRFRSYATLPPPDPHHRIRALSSALAHPSSFLRGGHVHEFPPPSRLRPQPFARPVSVTFLRPPSSALRPSSRPSALRLSSRPALFRRFGFRASSLGSWGVGFRASCFGFRGVLRGHVHWCTDAGKTRNRLTLSHFVSREKRLPARQTRSASRSLVMISNPDPAFSASQKGALGACPGKWPDHYLRCSLSHPDVVPCPKKWPNGAYAIFLSGEKPERARGLNINSLWADDVLRTNGRHQSPKRASRASHTQQEWRHRRHLGASSGASPSRRHNSNP